MVYAPFPTTTQTFALLCNNLKQLKSLKLMLQTSTTDLLNLSNKINHSRTIMTSPTTDTIPDGGITQISDGLALNNNNNNNNNLLFPSKMLLVQVGHTFLLQCNNNNHSSNNNRDNNQLRPFSTFLRGVSKANDNTEYAVLARDKSLHSEFDQSDGADGNSIEPSSVPKL